MQALGSATWTMLLLKQGFFDRAVRSISSSVSSDLLKTLQPVDALFTWAIIALSTIWALRIVGLDPSPLLTSAQLGSCTHVQIPVLNMFVGVLFLSVRYLRHQMLDFSLCFSFSGWSTAWYHVCMRVLHAPDAWYVMIDDCLQSAP
jgi:hypothetical protein